MAWVKVERAEKKVEPFSVTFNRTGKIQVYTIPATGLYKLQVWGGKGGDSEADDGDNKGYGGRGGYSVGYKKISKGKKLYIGCGLNGGGGGRASGGGASHIAFVDGTISSIGKETFDAQGLIVAGGGGGGDGYADSDNNGGTGGGVNGGNAYQKAGGTQTSGNAFGQGGSSDWSGGGGGYYGGRGGTMGGSGGSGWIGGVPEITYKGITYTPATSNGASSGSGSATISLIAQ